MTRQLGILGLLLSWSLSALGAEPWTLERALQQALASNPDARLAQQRIVAAQAGLDQANAAFWPRVQFQSSYTGSDNPMLVFGSILNQRAYSSSLNFNDVPTVDDLNTRGLVTVPLYAGGRNVATRKAASASTEAARQDNAAVRNALGFEVAQGFYTVLKTRQFIRAAEAGVNSFEASLVVAKKRLEGGTLLKSGVLDIEVRLAQAREELVRARNANALALRALRNLLGIEQRRLRGRQHRASRSGAGLGRFLRAPGTGRRASPRAGRRAAGARRQRRVTSRASTPSAAWTMTTAGNTSTAAAATPPAHCSSGTFGTAN